MDMSNDPSALMGIGVVGLLIGVVIWIVLFLLPAWTIVRKAGYSGAWSLLLLIPVVNIIALFVFAFSTWPVQRAAAGRS
jgi:uncharacterized membrane protein YhaH (DUF805 family)